MEHEQYHDDTDAIKDKINKMVLHGSDPNNVFLRSSSRV